ncbi:MAG: anhydro-N-acetylmuramic acid kinase [Alphaproteobacteria bacterium]|nr:anhydro-N-acetylmuramic acid kinase [Alphaproteobacteria bacterium]
MSDLLTRARRGERLRALGLMSGTSLDGIDLAVIETDGEQIHAFGPSLTLPYDEPVREAVRRVLGADQPSPDTAQAEHLVTRAYRDAIARFLAGDAGLRSSDVDVIGLHGQTITHRPGRRFTWQIGDAASLAREIGLPVVADFRSADVAAGGQGAPLVPIYHQALVRRAVRDGRLRLPVAVLNIGGVANITWIGEDGAMLAFDTGPGNAPLDDWVRRHGGEAFDRDGHMSRLGTSAEGRIGQFLNSPYFLRKPPKSLDRNDFNFDLADGLSVNDGAATLAAACAAAAASALAYVPAPPTAWVVTGGGAKNPSIINKLKGFSKVKVSEQQPDWDTDFLEAQAFGFLAVRSLRGLPLSFPTTTGVTAALTGGRLFSP